MKETPISMVALNARREIRGRNGLEFERRLVILALDRKRHSEDQIMEHNQKK